MFKEQPSLICATSSRHQGNMSLVYGDTKDALKNREYFLQGLGIDYRDLVCARQVHGSCARYVRDEDKGRGALSYGAAVADTDALVTDKKNLALAVFTADCLSIFLYDAKTPAVGLIHAGWQSTKENIAAKTLRLMQREFHTRPEDLSVGFGPAIRSCCYEVGGDFADFFPDGLTARNNRYYLDLVGINKRQILASGAQEVNIFDACHCTSCRNKDFFSYRKEGKNCGRMVSVIMLKSSRPGLETVRKTGSWAVEEVG